MKKIIGILVCLLLVLLAGIYYYRNQPKNIFDEIYQETERTYRTNNILRKIDGFDIRAVWPSDGEYFKYTPFGNYKRESLSEGYTEIRIGFNFIRKPSIMSISFEKKSTRGQSCGL